MTHPLTDAICYDIALKSGAWNTGFSNDDLRTAYDKGVADSSTAPTGGVMNDPKINDRRIRNNLIEIWTGLEWVVQPKANAPTITTGEIMTDAQ